MKRSRSLIVLMTVAVLLFAFAGLAVAAEADDAAERLKGFGVIEGYPDGTMGLEREITRAEFAKIAVVAKGLEEAAELLKGNASQFSDVQTNVWYTGWVNVANAQGIVKGDPVGTFRPNDNISVAEAVAMILRTLGYNDNLPGAWPTNYLVKGANLEITTGVVTNANEIALRGDVFTMLNRALDEDVVAWEYEDKSKDADFNKKGYTLIQEMKNAKEKTEGRVTRNSRTDSRYKADEVYVEVEKDAKDKGTSGKFTIMTGESVDYLLGLEVELFHNKDDEVYHIKLKTKESDIIFDSVDEDGSDEDRVFLKVEDKDYRWDEDAEVYINYDDEGNSNPEDLKAGQYGKFVMDGKKVVFASVFDFKDGIGAVTKVDGKVIEYVDNDANEQEVDLADADEYYILDSEFKNASMDNIKENASIYFWINDDDEYFVVVNDEIVEGTVDSIQDSKMRIDGKNYDKAFMGAVVTSDDGENYEMWSTVDDVDDLNGEDVFAVIDINNEILFVSSDAEAAGTLYGVVTFAEQGGRNEVTIYNGAGKEVTYKFEERRNLIAARIQHNDNTFDYYGENGVGNGVSYAVASFKVNKNGDIKEDSFKVVAVTNETARSADLGSYDKEISFSKNIKEDAYAVDFTKGSDDKYLTDVTTNGAGRFYINSNTVIIKALDDNELDPDLQDYAELVKSDISEHGKAVVFTEEGKKDAKLIVFLEDEFVGTGDDSYFGVVTANPEKDAKTDDWYVEIDVFEKGKDKYKIKNADRDIYRKGNAVEFKINSSGTATPENNYAGFKTDNKVAVKVTAKNGDYLTLDGVRVKIDPSAIVYEAENDANNSLGSKVRASTIKKDNYIYFIQDGDDDIIKAALLLKGDKVVDSGGVETDGTVTYIDNTPGSSYVIIDGKEIDTIGNAAEFFAKGAVTVGKKIAFDVTSTNKMYKITAIDGNVTFNAAGYSAFDGLTVGGNLTFDGDHSYTASNVIVKGNLVVGSGGATALAATNFDVTGTTTVNSTAAVTFNSELNGKVTVTAAGASSGFTNVKFGGDVEVDSANVTIKNSTIAGDFDAKGKAVTLEGSVTVKGAIKDAANVVVTDADQATEDAVQDAKDAADYQAKLEALTFKIKGIGRPQTEIAYADLDTAVSDNAKAMLDTLIALSESNDDEENIVLTDAEYAEILAELRKVKFDKTKISINEDGKIEVAKGFLVSGWEVLKSEKLNAEAGTYSVSVFMDGDRYRISIAENGTCTVTVW